ncbi:MAG: hypothetical protein JSU63_05975 [Phycisphaerales bacterium]|nr:MAG: hypothetical protein JSU63_05975 [Phycisphaerales bacterium]
MSARTVFAFATALLVCWSPACAPVGDNGGPSDGDGDTDVPALFVRSGLCTPCHNGLSDEANNDVSIGTTWQPTMMANAARDPYFLAKVSTEVARNPHLAAVIEDTCATCHMPMARTQTTAEGSSAAMLDDGLLDADNELHAEAMDGISCAFCHQIEDVGLGESTSFSGKYVVDTTTESPDRVNYGPYTDPDQDTMRLTSGFTPVYGEHVTEAALCATCHTLFTPYVDAEGNVLGEFPEQTAFLEWQHSDFGDGAGEDRTCQYCHMPDAQGEVVISVSPAGLEARKPFARHHFVGGNALMLSILDEHRNELEVAANAAGFEAVTGRVLDQLQNDAADLTIASAETDGDTLTVDLGIENKAGHKFPTGFPARRVWIHLTVADGDGVVFFESGASEADGSIVGNDADDDLSTFEPHYTAITSQDQVQIYESVMKNSDGEITYTLLRAALYAKDNRLLPIGFDKATAGADFATAGGALADNDFVDGWDSVAYMVDITGRQGPFAVAVELLYQSVAFPFVEDMRGEDSALAERFVGYFDDADKTPTVVATAEVTVQ